MVDLDPPAFHEVDESVGTINLCLRKSLETIDDLTLDLQYINHTASGNRMQYATQCTCNYSVHMLSSSS